MILLRPFEVGPSELTSSNVSIDETEWTAGTYSTGDQRYQGTTLYEVVADPDTSDEPTGDGEGVNADPQTWIEVGPINKFKMFDPRISDQTENASTISVTIDLEGPVTGVAFFGLSGTSLQVTLTDSGEGEVYDETVSLQDFTGITDWYSYFFEDVTYRRQMVVMDLPSYRNATLDIVISSDTTARCGFASIGKQKMLGDTLFGVSAGILDYSQKTTDDFGNFQITERAYSRRVDYPVRIQTAALDGVLELLASYRATPAVYVGDAARPGTVSIGYWRDFETVYASPLISDLNIEVEGLV